MGGVTGLSLYSLDLNFSDFSFHNDDCLAISLDTTDAAALIRYRIKNKGRVYELEKFTQIASGASGTTNMAIAVSQAHDAVALLGKDSIYFFQELAYRWQVFSGLNTTRDISNTLARSPKLPFKQGAQCAFLLISLEGHF